MLAILLNRAWGHLCVESDYVIIDTAPLTVSNDAIVFGSWTSGIILVTARGLCRKKNLEEVADSLRTAKVPVLGFVFNFANPKKSHNEAYYYYYYYYEDGAKRSAARRGRKH